jgi:competence protein ComEC
MFRVHFLDVGRGDTTILQFENGRTYLIDYYGAVGKMLPIDYLINTLGVSELEVVVITHPHQEHFLGILRLIEAIPIRQVWLSNYPYTAPSYDLVEQMLEQRKEIRVHFPRSGTIVAEGKDRILVLAPLTHLLRGTHQDVNNASIVLKVSIAHPEQDTSTNVVLGADAEIASWQQILQEHRHDLQAELLKVSHHGSQHGTDSFALAAIQPQYAVISVGSNPFGHPDPDTLTLIEEHTSHRVFRTDVDGTCVFESDGLGWNPVFP